MPLQHRFQRLACGLARRHRWGVGRVVVEAVLGCVFHVEQKPINIIIHISIARCARALTEQAVLHFLALRGVGVAYIVADEVRGEGEPAAAVGGAGGDVCYFYCGGEEEEEGGHEEKGDHLETLRGVGDKKGKRFRGGERTENSPRHL
jgi:hypothetical protein